MLTVKVLFVHFCLKMTFFCCTQVPLTVAELARTTYAVPTTVEDLISSNSNMGSNNMISSSSLLLKEATNPLTISTMDTTEDSPSRKSSSGNSENRSSGSLESLARSMILEPVVTSLPPLPRTLPPNLPKKSNSGILKEEEIIAFMDPVKS